MGGLHDIHLIIHLITIDAMKRYLLLFVFMTGLCLPPQRAEAIIVHDPITMAKSLLQWAENFRKWKSQLNAMAEAAKVREGLQNVKQLKQLKSLLELADLMDDVACLSSDYNFYINLGNNYHCLKFLNFQAVSANLNISSDLLFKVTTVSNLFSMNSEGRLSFITQAKEALEQSVKDMKTYNDIVRSRVVSNAIKAHTKKTYFSGEFGAYNRYRRI